MVLLINIIVIRNDFKVLSSAVKSASAELTDVCFLNDSNSIFFLKTIRQNDHYKTKVYILIARICLITVFRDILYSIVIYPLKTITLLFKLRPIEFIFLFIGPVIGIFYPKKATN